tara:strand:+ start:9308 stop:9763 length:456 start_codon:yes stop_codon:yes gene_type:complete
MYYQSQPGGFYGAQLGNIGGMPENTEDIANSFVITPGGDARRARKGLTVPAVNRLLEANPEFKKEIEDMYLPGAKATNFLKAEVPGSSNLIGAIGNMGGLANANFESLLAQNQGPSSPVKYYPDANQGQGGYLPNTGAGRLGQVRPKTPLA